MEINFYTAAATEANKCNGLCGGLAGAPLLALSLLLSAGATPLEEDASSLAKLLRRMDEASGATILAALLPQSAARRAAVLAEAQHVLVLFRQLAL